MQINSKSYITKSGIYLMTRIPALGLAGKGKVAILRLLYY